jgi:hypothetical protein
MRDEPVNDDVQTSNEHFGFPVWIDPNVADVRSENSQVVAWGELPPMRSRDEWRQHYIDLVSPLIREWPDSQAFNTDLAKFTGRTSPRWKRFLRRLAR